MPPPQNISLTNGATAGDDGGADERGAARLDGRHRGDRPPHAGAAGPLSRLQPRGPADRRQRPDPGGAGRGLPALRHPRGVRAALGDQSDGDADGREAARGDRRGGAQARHRHHRERCAGSAGRGPAAAGCRLRAGAHALRHQLHQDHRAWPAHRLSRRARPLCRRGRQPASGLELDGDADGGRDRHRNG